MPTYISLKNDVKVWTDGSTDESKEEVYRTGPQNLFFVVFAVVCNVYNVLLKWSDFDFAM